MISAKSAAPGARPDYGTIDLETVIQDLLTGQYNNPIRVIAFNTAERWSEDVSEDVGHELRRGCDPQGRDIPFFPQGFTDRFELALRQATRAAGAARF